MTPALERAKVVPFLGTRRCTSGAPLSGVAAQILNCRCPLGVKSGHYAAQQTAAYSITSSARNKSDVGMDMPRACAVRVGRSIGSAAGSAPRATLPADTS